MINQYFLASNIYVCLLIPSGGLKILSRCLASNVTSSSQPLGLYIFFFFFFSFLFFFLGLYIFFLQLITCPIEIVQTAQLHCFQNQVWPVQSRLKRCDVSSTDEQVYNEMNIIHFFASQHDAKKRPKNDTLI